MMAWVAQGSAWATETDIPGDERIKLLMYSETDVYTISTRYGYQTNIVFGPNEEIDTISVGDRSVWQIIPAGNRIFIRPMDEDITTNMTILTNKHSYQFDLKSLAADKTEGNIYVAKFLYSDEARRNAPVPPAALPAAMDAPAIQAASPFVPAPSVPAPGTAPVPVIDRNYRYTYSGSDELAPLQVYDDGSSTYIKYPALSQPLPSVSIVTSGIETPINYVVKDDFLVVHAVAGEMTVRRDNSMIHIFNENSNPR